MTALPQMYRSFLQEYRKAIRTQLAFHLGFGALFAAELLALLLFFPTLSHSAFFAFAVGALFLTCFTYFVLLFYFQANKPAQYRALRSQLTQEGQPHLSTAHSLLELASYLDSEEAPISGILAPVTNRLIERDLLRMKLLLAEQAVEEHLEQVRETPLDLEVHMSLGNAYVLLAKWLKERSAKASQEATRLAMQEYLILNQVAPHDPWVQEQLADGYRELGERHEELRQMERLRELKPQDPNLMLRLGRLSFELGHVAQGLKLYDELRTREPAHADVLMSCYGRAKRAYSEEI